MNEAPLYFDNNATTRVADEVRAAMLPYLEASCGNPSSLHALGTEAADAVAAARSSVARLLGAPSPRDIVFTSGGTESIHTALHTALRGQRGTEPRRDRVVTSAVEHAAVLAPLARLEAREGLEVRRIGVDRDGRLELEAALAAIDEQCALVTLQWVNNETGVVTSDDTLRAVGEACRRAGALFHVDAMQAPGKLPMDVSTLPLDLVSVSAHKFHGPKGCGALWVRPGVPFEPLFVGGPQESDRRAGTENVPAIVGAGRAAELARAHAADPAAREHVARLRARLERTLVDRFEGTSVHGCGATRVPSTTNLGFAGISGEAAVCILAERGVAASTGSACSSSRRGASHVLLAMGVAEDQALGALRLSLSRTTTEADVEAGIERISATIADLRALSPLR
jgi:cysteine desulfurase